MKIRLLLALLVLIGFYSKADAQFDKPMFRFGVGLAEPFGKLKGSGYVINSIFTTPQGVNYNVTNIDSGLFKNDYAAKTGFSIFGEGKINFDKYSIIRGSAFLGFTSFNTFESRKVGNQVIQYIDQNGQTVYSQVPISFDYTFSSFSFGFGLEIAPTSFTKVFSPFIGANLAFNVFSASLNRTKNNYDTVGFTSSGFRIGVNLNAGIEAKFSETFGMAIGVKYDLGNLLLRQSSNGNIAEVFEWGSKNANLNDEEGSFISYLPNNLNNATGRMYNSQAKNIDWATFYVAVTFYPFTKTVPKSPAPKK